MKDRKIDHLYLAENMQGVFATEENPIERFEKNGEMALVEWFRCGNREINGKYVIEIGYIK